MNALVFIDTETTGLDPAKHQAYEVAWAVEDGAIERRILPHTLLGADEKALEIGGYHSRKIGAELVDAGVLNELRTVLAGATLVGSNPSFDAAFLRNKLGDAPWSHRLVNVAEGGMWVFGWERPKGLAAVADELRGRGYVIPQPDHTAVADVAATRAVYYALRAVR